MSRCCFFCGSPNMIERHHVFGGSYRKKSDRYGYIVDLCHFCHNEPPDGVHFNKDRRNYLKRIYQAKFEETHTREEFIAEFGKSYAEDEE